MEIQPNRIQLTEIGRDFVQSIMNVFDVYDPPAKSTHERLETIKRAKEQQKVVQQRVQQ